MLFIETPIFTKLVTDLISDDEYRKIQLALVLRPEAGKIITGSGGLRKIRWKSGGSGKRGGLRLIYFWDVPEDRIYMLLIYNSSLTRFFMLPCAAVLPRENLRRIFVARGKVYQNYHPVRLEQPIFAHRKRRNGYDL